LEWAGAANYPAAAGLTHVGTRWCRRRWYQRYGSNTGQRGCFHVRDSAQNRFPCRDRDGQSVRQKRGTQDGRRLRLKRRIGLCAEHGLCALGFGHYLGLCFPKVVRRRTSAALPRASQTDTATAVSRGSPLALNTRRSDDQQNQARK
jgi:hypothetical protein